MTRRILTPKSKEKLRDKLRQDRIMHDALGDVEADDIEDIEWWHASFIEAVAKVATEDQLVDYFSPEELRRMDHEHLNVLIGKLEIEIPDYAATNKDYMIIEILMYQLTLMEARFFPDGRP